MAVRRARPPRKSRAVRGVQTRQSTVGALGGGDLQAAAEEIAGRARELASWSVQIPPSIQVDGDEKTVTISTDAPPAYPNETGTRHPLFARGPRDKWVWTDKEGRGFFNLRPFLGPAADERAGAAMARYAQKIDKMARAAGFSEDRA